MSARSHGSILDRGSSQSRVVQIYSRPTLDPTTYCPLQVTNCDTAQTVIQNAILMLGLDSNQTYRLIEVTASGKEENELDWDDLPLDLVLSWPPETQKWHPKEDGYYFVIQQVTDDNSCSEEYDDLCNLSDITEDSVTETLRQRFYKYKIYTYTSNILVAINPNKFLPVYYNPKYVKMYENQPLGKLSPHIFAVAAAAFRNMLSSQTNQCIVISGESGSGKTESSSYLVHCLTALSQQMYSSGLERTILGAAPVLEVSHPGAALLDWRQYGGGTVQGAVIEKYLLEKCRLVSREKNERNYHVFYNLLVGASKDEQKEFHLLKPHDYLYLRQVNLELDDEETLGQEYKRLHQAMEMVGFLPSTKKHIFSILSAILHLGNLTYSLSRDARGLEVGPDDVLVTLSELLKVKKEVLVKALTVRRAVASNFPCLCSIFQASKMRDSMAKTLYSALFDWIIFHINHALLNRRDMEEAVPCLSIGVLDMFGFEDLQKNSFEQLCINYTNEKIQCYINHHIFTMEQEDYVSEGIRWQNIDYADNSGCIELMSGKPSGLFKLLDTVRSFPDASAEGLLEKMKQQHRDNPFFVSDSESTFSVRHFAGSVTYHIKDFVEKNSEHMRLEVVSLLRGSERAFLHQLVCSSPRALFRWGVLRATIRIMTVFKHLGRKRNLIDLRSLQHIVGVTVHDRTSKYTDHPDGLITLPSVCTRFQASLQKLMERIKQAQPFFIVCLRSNYEKKEMHFDSGLVKRQVKCTGLLQMVLMQKAGYSAKYTFKEFVEKFRMLLPKWATPTPEHISHLLERMELDKSTYQIGKTKVFLKEHERQFLHETLNTVVMHHIVVLQRWFRGCLIRSHFLQKKDASRLIQRCWREFYEKRNRAATIIQMAWRTSLDRAESQQEERGSTRPGRDRYHYHSCIILNQCVLTDFWYFSALSSATLPHYHPHPYHMPSQYTDTVNRNPTIRISRATRATEWNSSLDREITNPKELRNLDEYLGNKVNELKSRIKELSPTEILFLTATKAFRNTIKSMFSVQVSYKDLMKGYQNKVITLAGHKQKTEVSLVVNLFQSVLDIFVRGELKRTAELDPTGKQTNRWRKKEKCVNHLFSTYQVTIMQSCDLCGSYIWAMEKAYMCSACKLICHKKCLSKIITDCSTRCSRMDDRLPGSLHFGVQVCVLTSKANPVPKVMELLLMHVEINGLYTEGIYRKSGSACRARELHQVLQTNPESACLDNYPIHTITGLVKRWLRELPDPLMTYALYNDFLHAAELPERSEQIRAVYQKVDELPPSNYNTLERLIFHLVRVAKEEEHNKMTSSSLAIVFAPCIMRSPDSSDPFLTMKDVGKITTCVDVLITEQLRRYTERMQYIQELENAEALAVNELQLRRQNTVRIKHRPTVNIPEHLDTDATEIILIERIKSIKKEKVDLACRLPDLEQEQSDTDNLDSSLSMSSESLEDRLKSLESEGQ
uniref:Myosin IXb n=1 Tax=Neogobius melanostomus TaxID=47308 RepID=A0A8C6UX19_9GOBI